uniref:Uncharacterized protein n=1 Tax=Cacopsylla melanoneura TaxID=428564 RepID=A0A8D8LEJ2_9HEMI
MSFSVMDFVGSVFCVEFADNLVAQDLIIGSFDTSLSYFLRIGFIYRVVCDIGVELCSSLVFRVYVSSKSLLSLSTKVPKMVFLLVLHLFLSFFRHIVFIFYSTLYLCYITGFVIHVDSEIF